MRFNEKEKEYIEQELNLPELEEGEKRKKRVYEDWLENEVKLFEDDSAEILEDRISETEGLRYHDKCSPTFYEIVSLRLKAENLALQNKRDEIEAIAQFKIEKEAKRVADEKASEKKAVAAKRKANAKKVAAEKAAKARRDAPKVAKSA